MRRTDMWWLRQVAVLVRDLDDAVRRVGGTFALQVCHRNDHISGYEMANALLPVGQQFLEFAMPLDERSPAARMHARRGDCGYLVILQTDDFEKARRRAAAAGAEITIEIDKTDARELHFHPRTTGGLALAVDWMQPMSSWRWAGPNWDRLEPGVIADGIAGVTFAAEQPGALAALWGQILHVAPRRRSYGFYLDLDVGWLRFVHRSTGPPALVGLHLGATQSAKTSVSIGDVRIVAERWDDS